MYRLLQEHGEQSWKFFSLLLLALSVLPLYIPLSYHRRSNHEGSYLGESPGHDIPNLLRDLPDTPGPQYHLGCNGCIEEFERPSLPTTGTSQTR